MKKLLITSKELMMIHFLGYRRDVVAICSQAGVFAFPSSREGLAPMACRSCCFTCAATLSGSFSPPA